MRPRGVSRVHLTAPERRRHLILLIGVLTALSPLTTDLYLPAFPAMGHDLHTGQPAIQLTLTAYLIGSAVGMLVAGPITDARGRIAPLRTSIALYVVLTLACAVAPDVASLVALRVAQGAIASTSVVVVRAIVRDLFEGVEVARFMSRLMMVVGFVPILAPFLGGQLLRVTQWRGIFVVLAVIGLLELVAMSRWLPETLPPERRRSSGLAASGAAYRMLCRDRAFLGAALASSFGFASILIYISTASFVFEHGYGLSPQRFGVIFGINALFMVAFSQVNAYIVGRIETRRLILAALLVMTVGGVVLVAVAATRAGGIVGLMVPLSVMLSALGFITANTTALALQDHPGVAGTASAFIGCLQFVVGGVLAPLTGLWGEGSAVAMGVMMAGSTVVALVAFLLVYGRHAVGSFDPDLFERAEALTTG